MTDDREARWYLKLMGPNPGSGWVYLTSLYVNARAFRALLDDLTAPFSPTDIDLVAGPDAMGFVLGAGIATRLGKGFLPIRKAGRVTIASDVVNFKHYSGRTERLELHNPAFPPGTRVLLVDQWIQTGGTMRAAIELVERQGGVVAGIATICMEDVGGTEELRDRYKCVSAVVPGTDLQRQCNAHWLDTFDDFDWDLLVPKFEKPSQDDMPETER